MSRVLTSVDWGASALSLLSHSQLLEPDKPAVMHIRHTERPAVTGPDSNSLISTPNGRAAAVEFGEGLPSNRKYRLFHTVVDRSRETAESIKEGLDRRGCYAKIAGVFPFRTAFDPEAMDDYIDRFIQKCGNEDEAIAEMMNRWLAGLAPPTIFHSSGEFARMIADYTLARVRTATSDALDIYVTHDTWVGCTLFHWFGVPIPLDGVRFLDGFLLQPGEKDMAVWFRDKSIRVEYPYWWTS